ncbi:DUF3310 domain-containing protein [Oxalobacter vibrioformis]|uniref:DUF3310 domain-containing protein n=1 Tax=Oxalobacter vibrioformis TaxID=933080 RepID=A0A9E9LUQ1_9BURK|nr:DUF3310 domain-containing protein [Oxalobacter vibrioformis]WAW09995.1 DUF3310 domain-containing protein [Oxalobacter vibrioformis]
MGTQVGATESIKLYDWVYLISPDSATATLQFGQKYTVNKVDGDFITVTNSWGKNSVLHVAELTKEDPALAKYVAELTERVPEDKEAPLETQVGGEHYKHFPIQPVEYIEKNGLGFCEGNAIKYLTRWQRKGGLQDLEKAKHNIEILISLVKSGARSGAMVTP